MNASRLNRTLASLSWLALATTSAHAEQGDDRKCSERTLKGSYGILLQGSRPSAPGGPQEDVIGVVIRHYDGYGGFTQTDNVKGIVTGVTPDRPGNGTYRVNADCTGVTVTQPGPGIVLEERIVITEGGRTILSMTYAPPPLMVTSVQRQIGSRQQR